MFIEKYQGRRSFFCFCHFLKTSIFEPLCFLKCAQFLTVRVNICESKIKNYLYFTDFYAKIYSLLTRVRKTPSLHRSHTITHIHRKISLEFLSERKLCILFYTFAYICQGYFWLGFCVFIFSQLSPIRGIDTKKTSG